MSSLRFLPFLAAAALASGCGFRLGSSTTGATGRAQFSYASGDGCFFGCAVDHPMMVGTTEQITVEASDMPVVFPIAGDASVLSVDAVSRTCCSSAGSSGSCRSGGPDLACAPNERAALSLQVRAVGAGATSLVLHATSGDVFDEVALSVMPPARLAPTCTGARGESVDLSVGETCTVSWKAFDVEGDGLQASQGIELTVSDPSVAGFEQILGAPTSSMSASQSVLVAPTLQGLAPGDTRLFALAGGAAGAMTVNVHPGR
jgi:hypothetical protein